MAAPFAVREHHGTEMTIMGPWSSEAHALVAEGKVDHLILNYTKGFQEPDLRFLSGLPISRLDITARWLPDLDPLLTLGDTLRALSVVTHPDLQLNLSHLPNLTDLGITWGQVSATIRDAGPLTSLYLGSYRSHDLAPLASIGSTLVSLRMKDRPSLTSLTGLEALGQLRHLQVAGGSRLSDVTALATAPQMTTLSVQGCRRFPSLEDFSSNTSLRELDISECGDFTTLQPLSSLVNLEELQMHSDTRVLDGDLTPLLALTRLRELRIKSRRSYRPTTTEILEQLGLAPW